MTINLNEYKNNNISVREYLEQTGKDTMSLEEEMNEAANLLNSIGCNEVAEEVNRMKSLDFNAVSRQIHRNAGANIKGSLFEKIRDERELDKFNSI